MERIILILPKPSFLPSFLPSNSLPLNIPPSPFPPFGTHATIIPPPRGWSLGNYYTARLYGPERKKKNEEKQCQLTPATASSTTSTSSSSSSYSTTLFITTSTTILPTTTITSPSLPPPPAAPPAVLCLSAALDPRTKIKEDD